MNVIIDVSLTSVPNNNMHFWKSVYQNNTTNVLFGNVAPLSLLLNLYPVRALILIEI